jgi:hypothetical protein
VRLDNQLSNLQFTSSMSANAAVHFHNVLSFGRSAVFPALKADFDMTWHFLDASLTPAAIVA